MSVYMDSNYDNIQYAITSMGSRVARDLGVYPISMTLPVLQSLQGSMYAQMFLGIILDLIVFILFLLSVMLLYNLLLVSVETKTYEIGVLRVLGLNKVGIMSLILVQCSFYVFPAVIAGILLSIPALELVGNALRSSLGSKISNLPTNNAIVFALVVGILIPILSSIVPIRQALGQTLNFALDVNRSKSQAVKVVIDVEGKAFPWGRVSFALVCALFGISIYYFLPLALISFNLALLINIFFWILIGLLVGFILLALNIQYLLERLIVHVFFWWTGSAMRTLIIKNLGNRRADKLYACRHGRDRESYSYPLDLLQRESTIPISTHMRHM